MPKVRKPKKAGGYETPSGYKIPKRKYDELKRAITNYNKRVGRAIEKQGSGAAAFFPRKRYLSEERNKVSSAKDINKLIRNLEEFRGEGLQLIEQEGVILTKAEAAQYKRAVSAANRQRKKRLARVQAVRDDQGRFPASGDEELREITYQPKTLEKMRKQLERISDAAYLASIERWRANYLRALDEARVNALVAGASSEVIMLIDEIRAIVTSVTQEQFDVGMRTIPEIEMYIWYDDDLTAGKLTVVKSGWQTVQSL